MHILQQPEQKATSYVVSRKGWTWCIDIAYSSLEHIVDLYTGRETTTFREAEKSTYLSQEVNNIIQTAYSVLLNIVNKTRQRAQLQYNAEERAITISYALCVQGYVRTTINSKTKASITSTFRIIIIW